MPHDFNTLLIMSPGWKDKRCQVPFCFTAHGRSPPPKPPVLLPPKRRGPTSASCENLDHYRDRLHYVCVCVEGKQCSSAVPSNASAKHMAPQRTREGGRAADSGGLKESNTSCTHWLTFAADGTRLGFFLKGQEHKRPRCRHAAQPGWLITLLNTGLVTVL